MPERPETTDDPTPASLPPLRPVGLGEPVRVEFRARLDAIDDALIASAERLVETLPRATRALVDADRGAVSEVCALTREVQDRCRDIEAQGFLLLAREAPVAGDLRRLVGILRLVAATSRAAALTRHVAEATDQVEVRGLPSGVQATFDELAARSCEVLRRGVDAWRQRDGLAVTEVDRLDEGVDRLQHQLLEGARTDVAGSAELLVLGLLGRYFERIADHGVAFARDATFAVTGERVDVRHAAP